MAIIIFGIPLIKAIYAIGCICMGIVGIAQGVETITYERSLTKEGKRD